MKYFTTTLFLLTSFITCLAQTAFPMIESDQDTNIPNYFKYWDMAVLLPDGQYVSHQIYMGEKCVKNGKEYTDCKIYDTEGSVHYMIREENDKVLYLSNDGKEYTIFDFNLTKGSEFSLMNDKYIVEDVGYFEDIDRYFEYYTEERPRMLKVRNLSTSEDDVFIQGIGSINWGLLPWNSIKNSQKFGDRVPLYMHVNAVSSTKFYASFFYNTGNYTSKVIPYVSLYDEEVIRNNVDDYDAFIQEITYNHQFCKYQFDNNELVITMVKFGAPEPYTVICSVIDNVISINTIQKKQYLETDNYTYAFIQIRFSGFEEGIYNIDGREYVCLGSNGIISKPYSNNQPFSSYDLQGRRLSEAPEKGIYIHNGRKVMK